MYTQGSGFWVLGRCFAALTLLGAAMTVTSVAVAANRAPTISGTPPTKAREGLAYAFLPKANDADGDTLTFSVVNRPVWASFNKATGALTGTPGFGTVGHYTDIRVRATDGVTTVKLPLFSIEVQQSSLGSVTLSWRPPTRRADGSILTNLDGYRIRYGTAIGNYPNLVEVPNEGLTSTVVSDLPPATYFFVISAYDRTGAESADAGPVFKTIR